MLSVSEAINQILGKFQPLDSETVSLMEASGRILAAPIHSNSDLPSFDNSSVDGFAVRSTDLQNASPESPTTLKVITDIPAGFNPEVDIQAGECARIMTGAPLPRGADSVAMVEDTDFNYRGAGKAAPKSVSILKNVFPGENVRRRGADVIFGQEVLPAQRRLRAQDIGLLAMLGISKVQVAKKPRVAILSSGDELAGIDEALHDGKIRDSNSYALSVLAHELGAEVLRLGIAKDQPDSIRQLLDHAVDDKVDILISSAGVSVGAFDYVRDVVELNGSMEFWKVNMRPGKPLAFGQYRGIPFFGLPGNPVSAFIGFMVFITPALEKLSGTESTRRHVVKARLAENVTSDGRESYLRAVVKNENGGLVARLTGHQASSNMLSMVQANALLIIPSGVKSVPLGQLVDAWLLRGI
jgi:molybdopterin molybdotransferase